MAHFKKTNKERDGHDIDESMREGAREREIDSQRERERERERERKNDIGGQIRRH